MATKFSCLYFSFSPVYSPTNDKTLQKVVIMDTLPKTGYMRPSQVIRHFQICESTLWNWVRKGAFPQPEKLSDGVSRFNVSEIRAWIQSKKDISPKKIK